MVIFTILLLLLLTFLNLQNEWKTHTTFSKIKSTEYLIFKHIYKNLFHRQVLFFVFDRFSKLTNAYQINKIVLFVSTAYIQLLFLFLLQIFADPFYLHI